MSSQNFPDSSFILGDYISQNVCDELIDYYNYNKKYIRDGRVGKDGRLEKEIKESFDLSIGSMNLDNIIGTYRLELHKVLEKYVDKFIYANNVHSFNIQENYNMQKYPVNGGFKKWHFENEGTGADVHRHLVFMTYLNDVEDGGTEFFYQNIKVKAEKGFTLIWPAIWTHTHRGSISTSKEKYIVTGWFSFLKERDA